MVLETITQSVADREPTPNKFTMAMGERIRKAREEAGFSQKDLAELIHRRQATLSDMETGKTEVSAGTLALLAGALEKPITYFYHPDLIRQTKPEQLSPLEQELIIQFNNVWDEHVQKVVIDIVKIIAKFNPEEMLLDSIDVLVNRSDRQDNILEILEKRRKQR